MKKKETLSERVEATRRKFENLLTDLAANQSRVERLNKMADEFVETGHSKQADVRQRQKEINKMWEMLQKMKDDKEKMLEGASRYVMIQWLAMSLLRAGEKMQVPTWRGVTSWRQQIGDKSASSLDSNMSQQLCRRVKVGD